jgi:hypothetical protein
MKLKLILLLALGYTLIGCSNAPDNDNILIEQLYPADSIEIIQIELGQGSLSFRSSTENVIQISLNTTTNDPMISISDETLNVDFSDSQSNNSLILSIPEGLFLLVNTYSADIHLNEISGTADIHSSAGKISLIDFQGDAQLRTGRGDIIITGGEGNLVLIGEHGTLSVEQFNGSVSMTTIMGEIIYSASENSSGEIHLETDHAPIKANIPLSTDYEININSSGGVIVCAGSTISRTSTGCTGKTGEGTDVFEIRSVSGRIDFNILP